MSQKERDIAGEVWDLLEKHIAPAKGKTALYDAMRERFPIPTAPQPEADRRHLSNPDYQADWWKELTEEAEQTAEYWREAFFDMRDVYEASIKVPQPEASDRDLEDAKRVCDAIDYDDVDDFSGRVRTIYDDSANIIAEIKATIRADERRKAYADRDKRIGGFRVVTMLEIEEDDWFIISPKIASLGYDEIKRRMAES
jgi:hypothetical protein